MPSIIITSVQNPSLDVETQNEVATYLNKLKELSNSDFCIEFSNVLAARQNIKMTPSSIPNFHKNQQLISSLNDRAAFICMLTVGQDKVLNYKNGDPREFIQLIENLDSQVETMNLDSEMYGKTMLKLISYNL